MQKITAKILVIDDDADILTAARVVLRQKFDFIDTESNPQKLTFLLQQNNYDVILLDMNYSAGKSNGNEGLHWLKHILSLNADQQVVIITAYGDLQIAVEAMKHGAADFIVKPWDNEKLEATVYAAYQHSVAKKELQQLQKKQIQYSRVINSPESDLISQSLPMQDVLNIVNKVSSTDANILLLGENGTGKDLIAKLIHNQSLRCDHPFIKVDVGALSANLFESELFGHKKGAFTDAKEDRIGRIELANEGTLFIDEIGNLPSSLQIKLLSVLQNREVTPLGGNKPIAINVRLICATNQAISDAVAAGHFREDLLYRINTVEIILPPLRMRPEDIPLLAEHFLRIYSKKYRKEKRSINREAIKYLQQYSWPGNVRELQHAIERAVIMGDGSELCKNDFLFKAHMQETDSKLPLKLDEMERKTIITAIRKHHGNMSKIAKELGVGRTTLYRKITKYGLDK